MVAAVAVLLLQAALPKAVSADVNLSDKTDAYIVQVQNPPTALPEAVVPQPATIADGAHPAPADSTLADSLANASIPQPAPALTAFRAGPDEVVRTNRPWLALTLVEHGAATFDAWSTRRALFRGRIEADPLLKPFVHSSSLYGTMQIAPGVVDFISHRMYRSQKSWVRKLWWVPQVASTGGFVYAGSYNVAHTH